jgi:hypothetical protein
MSVWDEDKIDFLYFDRDYVVLEIFDDLLWTQDYLVSHWEILQLKIRGYVKFIHSGQLQEHCPGKDCSKPKINICFTEAWPQIVENHLLKMKEYCKDLGYELEWVRYNPNSSEK